MVSHKHKAIFVHIPKSAGTSIGAKLSLYADESGTTWGMQDHRAIRHLRPFSTISPKYYIKPVIGEIVYRRLRDRIFLKRECPTAEQFDEYYKFAFVRNSWARVHSWYKNVMNDPRHTKRLNIQPGASFRWFVDNRLHTLKPQMYYLRDVDGELGVDFVGRFENLSDDFAKVCSIIGISNPELPERNRSASQGHLDHYDEYLVDVVRAHYKVDIDAFGFQFE
jgi:hypothetical protein